MFLSVFILAGCNANKEADEAARKAADEYAGQLEAVLPNEKSIGSDRETMLSRLDDLNAFIKKLENHKDDFKLSDGSYAGYEDLSDDAQ